MHATDLLDPWIGRCLEQRYRLDALLGIGGMAKVYRAIDEQGELSQPLAIKVLLGSLVRDPEAQARFQREISLCSHLRERRIVQVLAHGLTPVEWGPPQAVAHEQELPPNPDSQITADWPGSPYMVMEYISGPTLQQELQQHRRLSVERTLHLARHLVAGLRAAHVGVLIGGQLVRVVHRDLSPGNIYLVQDAYGKESIKLGDFGLARYVGEMDTEGLIHAGLLWGTLAYASPEQFRGGELIDPRSDLYSLGCILYEMLTGTHPLGLAPEAGSAEWMHAHIGRSPRPFPHELQIPLPVQQVVIRCLEKEPQDRFDSVAELDAALQSAQQALLTPTSSIPSSSTPSSRTSSRSLWWPWIGAALVPLGVGVGIWGYSHRSPSPLSSASPEEQRSGSADPTSAPLSDPAKQTRPLLIRGLLLLQRGDPVRAAVTFEEAVALDPTNGQAQAGLGIALAQLDRLDKAEIAVQAALELTPGDSFVRTAHGVYLAKQQDWDQARVEFELALQLNPENYLAQTALEGLP